MKKKLIILFLLFINQSFSTASENTPSLFGIELDSNVSSYELLDCFNTKNISGKLDSQGYLTKEKTKMSPQNWKDFRYGNSKLPVADGCVKPLESNDDFFNYKIHIYPKSKKIYGISAVFRKPYKKVNQCGDKNELFTQAMMDTNKKKGYFFKNGYEPIKDSKSGAPRGTLLAKGAETLFLKSYCSNYGHAFHRRLKPFDNTLENKDGYYLLVVAISNLNGQIEEKEILELKEEILKKDKQDKTGL